MAEFEPITTQEEFDKAIGERLSREKDKFTEYEKSVKENNTKYETRIKELEEANKKYADYDSQMLELKTKVQKYETDSVKTRVALECGLPYGMASRLSGDDEDSIRKDAQAVLAMMGSNKHKAPEQSDDAGKKTTDKSKADLRELLSNLTNKGE